MRSTLEGKVEGRQTNGRCSDIDSIRRGTAINLAGSMVRARDKAIWRSTEVNRPRGLAQDGDDDDD